MLYTEDKAYPKGKLKATYYDDRLREAVEREETLAAMRKVIKAEDMPWELCRDGRIKHVANEKMNGRIASVDVYIQEIPPGGRTGKHRHMREEVLYVLDGKGYDIHHDPDLRFIDIYEWGIKKRGKRFNWEKADVVYIPVMVAHQHFNADPEKPARIIIANPRLPMFMGCSRWEQLEDAPEYKAKK